MSSPRTAVHFGAGNIGRGFIGPLLSQSGYQVVFVDISDKVIDALNEKRSYTVHILDHQTGTETIKNVSGLKTTDPKVLEAIARADIVTTSVGPNILPKVAPVIADGLHKRSTSDHSADGVTIIACENMLRGTTQLKAHVEEAMKEKSLSVDFTHVGFADCAVDRIVPPFEGSDPLDVGVEAFYEWVVENVNVKGEVKTKGIKGIELVSKLQPFLERKLYTLNCGHAILAYIGYQRGLETVRDAVSDDFARKVVKGALEESGAGLVKRHSQFFSEEGHKQYIERTMVRYGNPKLKDILTRVGRTPLRKLSEGERLMGAVQMCREYNLPTQNLLIGIAAAYYFEVEEDDESKQLIELVKKEGIEKAVQQTTGLEASSSELKDVVKTYNDLGGKKSGSGKHGKPSISLQESRL